jgi:pimeloyl-ACP methyl ester carboxylesterase
MSVRRIAVALGLALGITYLALSGYMGHTLTTTAHKPFGKAPAAYGLPYEDVHFASRDDALRLSGWLIAPTDGEARFRPAIMVHGWTSHRESELGSRALEVAAHHAGRGRWVLMFDLRGWGQSEGSRFSLGPREAGDLGAAIDFLVERGLADDGVDLLGYSMGGATSLLVAADDERVRAVVNDSSYAELGPLLELEVPKASGLPPLFTPGAVYVASALTGADLYSVRPLTAVATLRQRRVPLMVIHGEADTLVPVAHGRRIAATYGPSADTLFVPGATHVRSYSVDPIRYLSRVDAFLEASS